MSLVIDLVYGSVLYVSMVRSFDLMKILLVPLYKAALEEFVIATTVSYWTEIEVFNFGNSLGSIIHLKIVKTVPQVLLKNGLSDLEVRLLI